MKTLEMIDKLKDYWNNYLPLSKRQAFLWLIKIEKELKALNILIKWYQPDIIHDLCCFGASDEEIALVKEILNEHR